MTTPPGEGIQIEWEGITVRDVAIISTILTIGTFLATVWFWAINGMSKDIGTAWIATIFVMLLGTMILWAIAAEKKLKEKK